MNIGDWVLAASGKYWYMSYIDSFSKDLETVHVTKITRFVRGITENIKQSPSYMLDKFNCAVGFISCERRL